MGGTTTRGRKKAAAGEDEQVAHDNDLQARVEQVMASFTVAQEQRAVFEAEVRQKMTETKCEQQQLRERCAQLLVSQKEQRDAHHELQLQQVATKSSVETFERHLDRFLSIIRASASASREAGCISIDQPQHGEHQDVDAGSDVGSDVGSDISFAAESRVSELSDVSSIISTAASTTRYAHSSIEAVRKALSSRR